jgi:dTDP-4-amino-4,6-dideoxygalactose transaminase
MRSSATRAVLTVSLYGHPGTVLELERYCHAEGLFLVEDACQSFGATIDNRPLGTIGKIGVFSFFPTKPLGGTGDGGLLVTSDEALAETAKRLRSHGINAIGKYSTLGGNFRLDALQAALLAVKLGHVDEARHARCTLVEQYRLKLAESSYVLPPALPADSVESAWSLFTLRIPRYRDRIQAYLAQHAIEARAYYSTLLSEQPALSAVSRSDDLPVARAASQQVLSIPCYAGLLPREQQRIIDALLAFLPDP